jgi:hypothetical protein
MRKVNQDREKCENMTCHVSDSSKKPKVTACSAETHAVQVEDTSTARQGPGSVKRSQGSSRSGPQGHSLCPFTAHHPTDTPPVDRPFSARGRHACRCVRAQGCLGRSEISWPWSGAGQPPGQGGCRCRSCDTRPSCASATNRRTRHLQLALMSLNNMQVRLILRRGC